MYCIRGVCTFIVSILGINVSIVSLGNDHIIGVDEAKEKEADCILVLGASVCSNFLDRIEKT